MTKAIFIFTLITFSCIFVFPAVGAESINENYQALLDELQEKIDNADKSMVAHPTFLEELRLLVEKYRSKIRNVFLSDNFADGNYTKNPAWIVDSGQFRIDSAGRLLSEVATSAPVDTVKEEPISPEKQVLGIILKEITKSGQNQPSRQTSSSYEPKEAVIKVDASIAPAFEIDISFYSRSEWGSMEVALLGGSPVSPLYILKYQAAASKDRPIEIIRQRGGRSYTIDSALRYPNLDDNKPHRLQWIRDTDGTMKVLIDGQEIVKTVEAYYRDGFSGLALMNKGGYYAWDSVKAMTPLP